MPDEVQKNIIQNLDTGQEKIATTETITELKSETAAATTASAIVGPAGSITCNEYYGEGDGWVAIGKPDNVKYAQVNFDTVSNEELFTSTGCVPEGTEIKSRWAVNLRENVNNTESGTNKQVGLLAPDQCAKVLKSLSKVRGQTWAFVELMECTN